MLHILRWWKQWTLYIFKSNSLSSFHMICEPDVYIIEKKPIPIFDWLTRRVKSYNAIFSAICLQNISFYIFKATIECIVYVDITPKSTVPWIYIFFLGHVYLCKHALEEWHLSFSITIHTSIYMYAIIPQDCGVDIASYLSINKSLFKRIRNWLVYFCLPTWRTS